MFNIQSSLFCPERDFTSWQRPDPTIPVPVEAEENLRNVANQTQKVQMKLHLLKESLGRA
jgi:hypothetical protein